MLSNAVPLDGRYRRLRCRTRYKNNFNRATAAGEATPRLPDSAAQEIVCGSTQRQQIAPGRRGGRPRTLSPRKVEQLRTLATDERSGVRFCGRARCWLISSAKSKPLASGIQPASVENITLPR